MGDGKTRIFFKWHEIHEFREKAEISTLGITVTRKKTKRPLLERCSRYAILT